MNNYKSAVTVMIKKIQGIGEQMAGAPNWREDYAEK